MRLKWKRRTQRCFVVEVKLEREARREEKVEDRAEESLVVFLQTFTVRWSVVASCQQGSLWGFLELLPALKWFTGAEVCMYCRVACFQAEVECLSQHVWIPGTMHSPIRCLTGKQSEIGGDKRVQLWRRKQNNCNNCSLDQTKTDFY